MLVLRCLTLISIGALVACPAPSQLSDAGPGDAGPGDAGTWRIHWSSSPDFLFDVSGHTSFVGRSFLGDGTALYVVGGFTADTDRIYDAIYAAPILDGGELGSWTRVGTLNERIATHAMTSTEPIYLAGGLSFDNASLLNHTKLVSALRLNDAGEPEIVTHSFFPQPALHAALENVHGHLVMAGGTVYGTPSAAVWSVTSRGPGLEFDDAGVSRSLAFAAALLPQARTNHASLVHDGRMYLVGGHSTGQAPTPTILRSTHNDAGVVSGWDAVGTLDPTPTDHGVFEHAGFLYVVGGNLGATTQRVRRAPFLADGSLGAFVDVDDALILPRADVLQTPVFNDVIYSVGGVAEGRDGNLRSLSQVDVGRLKRE